MTLSKIAQTLYVLVHIKDAKKGSSQEAELARLIREHPSECYDGQPCLGSGWTVRYGQSRLRQDTEFLPEANKLPPETEIKVCGAFRNICVANVLDGLLESGYRASLHESAVVD